MAIRFPDANSGNVSSEAPAGIDSVQADSRDAAMAPARINLDATAKTSEPSC